MIPVEDSTGIFTPNETGVIATLSQSNYINCNSVTKQLYIN